MRETLISSPLTTAESGGANGKLKLAGTLMASGFSTSLFSIFAVIGLAMLAIGVWLGRIGWFPRRTGSEPRCRKCGYQLQGIASSRCPECGSEITPSNTVHGVRRRKPMLVIIAAIVLLVGLGLESIVLVNSFGKVDWYQYRPTRWLISDIANGSPTTLASTARAWSEINRRIMTGKLSAAQTDSLADACIARLAPGIGLISDPAWTELMRQDTANVLGASQRSKLIDFQLLLLQTGNPFVFNSELQNWSARQFFAGKMSQPQQRAYLDNLLKVNVEIVRPAISLNARVLYEVNLRGRGPSIGFWYRQTPEKILIDGREVKPDSPHGTSLNSLFANGSTMYSQATAPSNLAAGEHTLTVQMRLKIYAGTAVVPLSEAMPEPLSDRLLTLESKFTVLSPGTPGPVSSVADPSLRAAIEKSVLVEGLAATTPRGVSLAIRFTKPPVDIAFDVFALLDGKEQFIEQVVASKNSNFVLKRQNADLDMAAQESVDLVLRSSEAAAESTNFMTQIWKGEIIIKNVPITPAKETGK